MGNLTPAAVTEHAKAWSIGPGSGGMYRVNYEGTNPWFAKVRVHHSGNLQYWPLMSHVTGWHPWRDDLDLFTWTSVRPDGSDLPGAPSAAERDLTAARQAARAWIALKPEDSLAWAIDLMLMNRRIYVGALREALGAWPPEGGDDEERLGTRVRVWAARRMAADLKVAYERGQADERAAIVAGLESVWTTNPGDPGAQHVETITDRLKAGEWSAKQ